MTPKEICKSYRESKVPKEQIKILADLNGCAENDIIELLEYCGEPIREEGGQFHRIHGVTRKSRKV